MSSKMFFLFTIFLSLINIAAFAQKHDQKNTQKSFVIASYNVENLFDTIDQVKILDDEFTPLGKKKWDSNKYLTKIANISKVILKIADGKGADIIGLCEIENDKVLDDVLKKTYLKPSDYAYIHYDCNDSRGLDVALIYKKASFIVLNSNAVIVNLPDKDKAKDILYVKGVLGGIDTIHLFINNWFSRFKGAEITELSRNIEASKLKSLIDSVKKVNANQKIIVMGDFNDNPNDNSIANILNASEKVIKADSFYLYNPFFKKYKQKEGTTVFKDKWDMFDQIIVSNTLIENNNGLFFVTKDAFVFNSPWISYRSSKSFVDAPNRTYLGDKYVGGFSDHYPVYILLKRK